MKIYFDDELVNENYYAGLTRTCSLFENQFRLGVSICDTYKLTLNNDYGNVIPNVVKIYENEVLVKTLFVDSYNLSDFTIEFDLVDSMVNFNIKYDASHIIETSETGKVTVLEILQDICSKVGIGTDITEFNQSDLEVNYYDNTITARTYIEYMAELDGSYAYITADNKLAFKKFKTIKENKISFDEISKYEIGNSREITRVLFDNGVEYYESGEDTGLTYYVNTDNVFCTNNDAVSSILESVKGQPFYNFNTQNCPILYDVGDIVTFTDGTNDYPTIFQFNGSINYMGGEWFGGIKLEVENAKQEETEIDGIDTKVKAIKIKVDRNENKITQLITETDTIQDNLNNNYYTITKTNELLQSSANGITNTFSEAGGNNVFRNTGLWFEDTGKTAKYLYPGSTTFPSDKTFPLSEPAWEYWNGYAVKVKNDQAVLNTAILLQSGYFSQEQDVPNGSYSISFYYQKLNETANAYVTINNKKYDLDSTELTQFYTGKQDSEGNYITFPIDVTAKHIKILFETDINNSVIIYDLMCNKGTVKLAYSQNENEVTTDTVNISKGITITSNLTDTKFKADSDGIRVLNKNSDEKITDFTDKGMTTKEAIVENEATIVKLLIQDISEQTWLTRI